MKYQRNREQGRSHRAKLRAEVVPYLRLGSMLPTAQLLGRLLGISPAEAARHMRRVLDEDGIQTVRAWSEGSHRIFVTNAPVTTIWVRSHSGLSFQHFEVRT